MTLWFLKVPYIHIFIVENCAFEIENIYSEIKVRHYMNGANAISLDIK